jgi:hypothetical protein
MVGGLVEELRLLASTSFINFRVSSVSRDCNRVAHELAAVGCNCDEGSETIISLLSEHFFKPYYNQVQADQNTHA